MSLRRAQYLHADRTIARQQQKGLNHFLLGDRRTAEMDSPTRATVSGPKSTHEGLCWLDRAVEDCCLSFGQALSCEEETPKRAVRIGNHGKNLPD